MRKMAATMMALVLSAGMLTACAQSATVTQQESSSNESAQASVQSQEENSSSSNDYRIAVVVKGNTNGWFIRMQKGIDEWSREKGIEAWMTGPTDTDSAQQIQIIQDVINQDIDALCVVPVDPEACEPVLKEAMDKGIVVITHEGSTGQNTNYDLEAFNNAGYGAFIMDNLSELMGGKGTYTTMVGFLTSASHNEWADGAVARQKEAYNDMQLLEALPRIESENNTEMAYEKAKEALKKYPEIAGFTGSSSDDAPGIARAINELGLSGKVFVVGTGMPNECRELIKNGSLTSITLWDPADAGYAMCELAKKVLDGETISEGANLGLSAYENLKVDPTNPKVLMGNGFIAIDKDNIDDYDF